MALLSDPRTDGMLDRLERVLEACLQVQEALTPLLARKREAVVKMNLRDIQAANVELEGIASRWTDLEAARRQTLTAIATQVNVLPAHLGLPELIQMTDDPRRGRLVSLRARLKARAVEVARLNLLNHSLVEHSLHYVKDMIRLLTHWGDPQNTYGRDGKPAEGKGEKKAMIDHVA